MVWSTLILAAAFAAQADAAAFSPPWYPAPPGGTLKSWAGAYSQAASLVSQMTLLEKVNITTGLGWSMGLCVGNTGPVPRLGFPSLCLQDGPLGIRFADKITSFPAGITTGSTWDKQLMRARGEAMGAEFRGKGVNVALGPSMGALGKMPAGGRNWEGFGSDPYLQGIGARETILGIQSQGVVATAKHLVGNEQEHYRQGPGAVSVNIDDRTLHEIYLWPFAESVKAGVGAVMCSYNKLNNSAACQNSWLQNGILKDELGFQGFIMSDWLAQMGGVASVLAGMDMTMPGDGYEWDDRNPMLGPRLTEAVLNSSVPISRLDDMVTRIVATWYKFGQDKNYPEPNFSSWTKADEGFIYWGSNQAPNGTINKHVDVTANHAQLARKVAAEGTVLLKNEKNALPLAKRRLRVGIYGEDAALDKGGPNVCADRGCNQGTLAVGWGSGTTDFEYLVDPLSAISKQVKQYGGSISSITNNTKLDDIAKSARKQDVCLAFVNADSGEGYISWEEVKEGDRPNLNIQKGGDDVVLAVANNCDNTIVVVHSVGPVILEKWIKKKSVRAVVWANLPGQESGNALVDVLWGAINPSGKLAYTIGKKLEDYGEDAQIIYQKKESEPWPQQDLTGVLIDYRHFDEQGIQPRFEFGFGLSYTTFAFSQLTTFKRGRLSPLPAPRPPASAKPPTYNWTIPDSKDVLFPSGFRKINRMIYPYIPDSWNITKGPYPYPDGYDRPVPPSPAGGAEGGNPALWEVLATVSVSVKNTGKVAGAEVAQLYLEFPRQGPVPFPKKQLRGFEKVFLRPGESKKVTFELTRKDFSYWDVVRQNWVIPSPGFTVHVGTSSRKIKSKGFVSSG